MDLQLLLQMIARMIINGERHRDYERVCTLQDEYKIFTTGVGIGAMLQQFNRESDKDLAIRVKITQPTTPAIAASLRNPFNKVIRNDRVKKGIELKSDRNKKKVEKMIESFYGSAISQNKGVEYWMKTKKFDLSFSDPNAWVVVEWGPVALTEIPKPYPFVLSSKEAINFEFVNDELQWLLSCKYIKFQTSVDPKKKLQDGKKYIMYHSKYTVVFEQVDKAFIQTTDFKLGNNQQFIDGKGKDKYLVTWFEPKIGFPPAFRIGYKPDLETDSRTFVIPWHDAMAYFKKSLKTISELDLTMASHVYPQKLQYTPLCMGESKAKPCKGGRTLDGSVCGECNGSGLQIHKSSNDVMLFPMPADFMVEKDRVPFDLDNIIVYKAPPIDLVKLQIEYSEKLEYKAHEAVFNSQMFNRKTATTTATEIDTNMESIYDTLEAFTEKESELYKSIVTVFALLVNEKPENINIVHVFPADFKLKTKEMLLNELKLVNESGAPSFVRDSINLDIAEITFNGDNLGLLKYKVRRRFNPFNGKSESEIMLLMASPYVSEREKVLYANFETIFTEIEAENVDFYLLPTFDEQFNILEEKINEWIAATKADKPQFSFTPLSAAAAEPGAEE